MRAVQINSQVFLEEFRQREPDETNFFYGMEKNDPLSAFLFYRHPNHQTGEPAFPHTFTEDTFAFEPPIKDNIQLLGGNQDSTYIKVIQKAVFCAAEQFTQRCSLYKHKCFICGREIPTEKKIKHVIRKHPKELYENLQANTDLLTDDEVFMEGLFTKLQFDDLIPAPSSGFPISRRHRADIKAPQVTTHFAEEEETADPNNPDNLKDDIDVAVDIATNNVDQTWSFTYDGLSSPIISKFVRAHTPHPPKRGITEKQFLKIEEDENRKAEELILPIFETYICTPKKNPPSPPSIKTPELKTTPPPAVASPTTEDILDINMVELPTKQNGTSKQKQPKNVSYIDSIPQELRKEVIQSITRSYLSAYAETNVTTIVRPILAKKKKENQKRMREEKIMKAKNEEKQKLTAMRQRRQLAVQRISTQVLNPLIRQFIRSEATKIFEQEVTLIKEETKNFEKELEQKQTEGSNTPPPVILSGLVNRKHLNLNFLRDFFGGYNFVIDETGEPKIRFRFNGNRCDVLLFFATNHDVMHALAQNPIQIEFSTATLSVEQEDENTKYSHSFTGQEIKIVPVAKNIEDFSDNRGKSGYVNMSPLMPLDLYVDREYTKE